MRCETCIHNGSEVRIISVCHGCDGYKCWVPTRTEKERLEYEEDIHNDMMRERRRGL